MSRRQRLGPVTAGELLESLKKDSTYRRMQAQVREVMRRKERTGRAEEAPLVGELRRAGVRVRTIWDLVNTTSPYPSAIPVLISHLARPYSIDTKEGIIRALTVKEARGIAAKPLMASFRAAPSKTEREKSVKWAIGNALSVVADDSVFKEISALVRDKSHGIARSMLALAFCNMQKHRNQAIQLLLDLLDDKDVRVQAMIALGNLRVKSAQIKIEAFLCDQDSWVRQQAKRALAKIDKARS